MAHRTASGATPRRRHGAPIQFSVIGDAVRKRFRKGRLSQQGCQQTRRRQRRNWRVRAVERGQRSEPAWLRAHPGLHYFEPEKLPRTQIPRNVWDTGTARMGGGVNYNSERNLAKRKLAQFDPDIIRLTAHNSTLQTKSLHAHSGPEGIEVRKLIRGTTGRASNLRQVRLSTGIGPL